MRCKQRQIKALRGHVIFHIFTNMGYLNEDGDKSNVMMEAGSYFLITHTCFDRESADILHVYMRHVEIGLGRNVALWLDDN